MATMEQSAAEEACALRCNRNEENRCGQPAKMQCPTCLKMKLPKKEAAFCTQECFKSAWKDHKEVHQWGYAVKRGSARVPTMPKFAWTGTLRPDIVGPMRKVPDHISRPDYADTGYPEEEANSPYQKSPPMPTPSQVEKIKEACRIGRECLDLAHRTIGVGVTTDEVDRVVHEYMVECGAYPSPLNYYNFPKSLCTSVNEVVCHGIPDKRELQEGDILNVDITACKDGYNGDLNETFVIGKVDDDSKRVIKTAHDCLMKAIEAVKPGVRFRDLGQIISNHAHANNCSVVKTYCGHGIGELFHCAPSIPHYAHNKAVGMMKKGQVFTIEPMINLGTWHDCTWPDGWTAVTKDGKRSAQFEHQLLVTETGCDVLTKRLPTSPLLWWEE
mmetsp:Transcript_8247/g.51349  ORF Transcript_8247/g.51349 Transcript_8247/m.51349 type:complete len:386 (-) Transcript_8247:1098-2255(-)